MISSCLFYYVLLSILPPVLASALFSPFLNSHENTY
jgi:hypothetical protein